MTTAEPAVIDCVVVGAGPVGLVTALLLAGRGHSVTVIERWPQRYPMPRACTIDHEALRILQAAGVMSEHSDLFEPSRGERGGYQVRNAAGTLLLAFDWNRTAESGWANTNGFYQPDLEDVLEAIAGDLPGIEIRRGWAVTDVVDTGNAVDVHITSTTEESSRDQLRASWVVAADGANSVVRTLLGIDSIDSGFEADWLVADYRPIIDREWDAFVTQYCDPAQPATAVNSGPGRRRFEFMRPAGMSAQELGRPETAWRLMSPWGVTPANSNLERHAVYTFRGRWAQTWRRGRVLLAGDAAHLMPPFLGQGLCAGLRDARSLSWRLSLVLDGLADSTILDSYETERTAHVQEIIEEAVAIGRVICEVDPERVAQRDARMIAELTALEGAAVEPPHPRLGDPSLTYGSSDAEGRLCVQGRVVLGGRVGLFDDLIGGTWQLIGVDVEPAELLDEQTLQWFRQLGGSVTRVSRGGLVDDIDATYETWFAEHGCEVVLSRPDFYVYFAGSATQLSGAMQSLATTVRHSAQPINS
ncbi:MAG: bifunctional 3-(3-hydroxy-phenyl)propionate/3-hydroxycinnamic acid hydroxylase [Actinomycetota bacterium]|nr:bifunctional 3-(3-hydroxy-phenyl)propionate/3-hydroxycinnamic acid hydroxylase [Actinomycetota bacterium]